MVHVPVFVNCLFQSTHLLRGATPRPGLPSAYDRFQSTHLLRGATSSVELVSSRRAYFNPRTSCEVRRGLITLLVPLIAFQSTHLLRGATLLRIAGRQHRCISIHAPLARCDRCDQQVLYRHIDFNPRTSCEVRHPSGYRHRYTKIFQSTHLLRGATQRQCERCRRQKISIHAPLARCDLFLQSA